MNSKSLVWALIFTNAASLGALIRNDGSLIFLAVAAVMAAYAAVCFFFDRKRTMIIWMAVIAILSYEGATAAKAAFFEGLVPQKAISPQSAKVFVGEVRENYGKACQISQDIWAGDYSSLKVQYQLYTMALALLIGSFFILKKETKVAKG